jgi:hypothetical protein
VAEVDPRVVAETRGLAILGVGLTDVFVPEDLAFMRVTVDDLHRISPRLVPLIAHDRVGFGAAVLVIGATALICLWCGSGARAQWETFCISGLVSLTAAIGTHSGIGYTDLGHLVPVLAAAASTIIGLALTFPKTGQAHQQRRRQQTDERQPRGKHPLCR